MPESPARLGAMLAASPSVRPPEPEKGDSSGALPAGGAAAPITTEQVEMVSAPHYRGYANLGAGGYLLNNSAEGDEPELIISVATEEEKAGRSVGDLRENPPGCVIQPEQMAVRIRFANVRGLDALEQQLRFLRKEHFPTQRAVETGAAAQPTTKTLRPDQTETAPAAPPTGSGMPNPTEADLADPVFEAIWQATKSWDVNVPEFYKGYCGLNGSHVMLILNAIRGVREAPPALTDERILEIATELFPMWREDIQPQFVLRVVRAALGAPDA